MLKDHEDFTRQQGIAVEADVPAVSVQSDREMLRHLLANLVSNVVKFRLQGEGRRIAITASSLDGEAVIRVADNGVGLKAEEARHAFDRFYQSQASRDGSGAGLTICRMIAHGLGGRIAIESESRDRGAVVLVTLPLSGQAGSGPDSAASEVVLQSHPVRDPALHPFPTPEPGGRHF